MTYYVTFIISQIFSSKIEYWNHLRLFWCLFWFWWNLNLSNFNYVPYLLAASWCKAWYWRWCSSNYRLKPNTFMKIFSNNLTSKLPSKLLGIFLQVSHFVFNRTIIAVLFNFQLVSYNHLPHLTLLWLKCTMHL